MGLLSSSQVGRHSEDKSVANGERDRFMCSAASYDELRHGDAMASAHDDEIAPAAARRATPSPEPTPLTRFVGPRYWPTWLFVAWLRLTAALPWRFAIGLHRLLGRALYLLLPSRRHIVLRNLEICFPELAAAERRALARRHFASFGASIAEIAIAWFATAKRARPPMRVEGLEHLEAALAAGRGAILYSGHFTTLELAAQYIDRLTPSFAFMFKTRSNALLDALQTRGRRRSARMSVNNSDVRGMLRMLRRNAAVWYAPDQAHSGRHALLMPFFGEPAMTNTATMRLARISGTAVVPLFFRRLPAGQGYLLRFEPALADRAKDVAEDQARLTAILERFIRECPEQYLWTHRKFKNRGAGLPDVYARTRSRDDAPATARATLGRRFALPLLIGAVALFVATLQNAPLWKTAMDATLADEHRVAILWSLFAILFCTPAIALGLIPGRRPLKIAAGILLLVGAVCSYFMSEYGIVIDESMVRNAIETTALEATPFLGGAFVWHLFFFGIVPATVVGAVRLPQQRPLAALFAHLGIVAAFVTLLVGTLYANFGAVSFFAHQHHTLRLLMNPGYPLYATARYFVGESDIPVRADLPVRLAAAAAPRKPALVVFVLGETARADRFSHNGYARDTNRYTRLRDVVNFPDVRSCGTSTAESVPCLFSNLGQARFSHDAAERRESWFAALGRLGVDVFWRDNSTGCKDVCAPDRFEELADATHPRYCNATGCFDEILLENFAAFTADRSRDHFIVLHQRGSHGPAYHTDAPREHKQFLPECDLPNLRNCSRDAINNAYDNTILYTDYFLSRVIDTLEANSAEFSTAMLYVSDHGESLGENGLYLHGFPYSLAPEEQKRVPMLLWASKTFYEQRIGAARDCATAAAQRPATHDALMHTILPWFGVESADYDENLDLFAACRRTRTAVTDTRMTPLQTAIRTPGAG